MGKFGNRLGNTAMVIPRVGGTVVNTGADTINFLVAPLRDVADVIENTANSIRDVFIDAWRKGKWYERVGNVALSPIVATGTAVEGIIRTAVTPVINGIGNGVNTVKNAIKNGWRSTFGKVFSKEPLSDFSYDQLRTGEIISKNKNRFSQLQFGKKKRYKSEISENKVVKPAAIAGTAATTAVAASAAGAEEVAKLKENINNLNNQITKLQNQLKNALGTKKPDIKETKLTKDLTEKKSEDGKIGKNTADGDKASIKKEKNDDIVKSKDVEETKGTRKKTEDIEKKVDEKTGEKTSENTEKKIEKDGDDGNVNDEKDESLDTDVKNKGIDEARKILEDSDCGQKILDGLCKKYKDFGIVFDKSTSRGRFKNHTITIGTKMPDNIAGLAPLNRETKDSEYQKRHLLLHELSHGAIIFHKDEIPEIHKGLGIIERYLDKNSDGRTLSLLSYKNEHYETNREKAKEDFVEMLALAMNGKGTACKKYMELLSDDEHKEFREKNGLATITKDDAEALENVCKAVVKFYKGKKD